MIASKKFSVAVVELDARLEQQSALTVALAAVGTLAATSAQAVDNSCGNMQDMPCSSPSCSIFSW